MAGDDVEERFAVAKDFGDTYVEVLALMVPESDEYPDGVNYRMQYGHTTAETAWNDGTIFRYDNKADPNAPAHHHKHTIGGEMAAVEFDGLEAHYRRFKREVIDNGEPWH